MSEQGLLSSWGDRLLLVGMLSAAGVLWWAAFVAGPQLWIIASERRKRRLEAEYWRELEMRVADKRAAS